MANERTFAAAKEEGFPILADTRDWDEAIAGNSVRVAPAWLQDGRNREASRRFLKASIEGIALFHNRPEIALDVLARWHGIVDRQTAESVYARGATIPIKPYPCYEGIRKTMELYDSNEMRQYEAEDFYDDSILRALDESGFIDSLQRSILPEHFENGSNPCSQASPQPRGQLSLFPFFTARSPGYEGARALRC